MSRDAENGGAPERKERVEKLALRAHRGHFAEMPCHARKVRKGRMGNGVSINANSADRADIYRYTFSVSSSPANQQNTLPVKAFEERAGRDFSRKVPPCRSKPTSTFVSRYGDGAEPRQRQSDE